MIVLLNKPLNCTSVSLPLFPRELDTLHMRTTTFMFKRVCETFSSKGMFIIYVGGGGGQIRGGGAKSFTPSQGGGGHESFEGGQGGVIKV